MKNKYYCIDILNTEYWVNVCIGKDYKDLSRKLKKHFDEENDSNFSKAGFENVRGKILRANGYAPYIFVNMNKCKTKKQAYATLAHEACHAIDHIFNEIGDDNRDELFAHSVSAIIRGVDI